MSDDTLLDVQGLRKDFLITKGLTRKKLGTLRAVDDISLSIDKGEILGLVGESGCGKTTTGRCIIRAYEPTAGKILYRANGDGFVDIKSLDKNELYRIRRSIRMIFQDPFSSLNPRMNVLEIVGECLRVQKVTDSKQDLEERVAEILRAVGMDPKYMRRYPHAFSGGQRQRIAIARALVLNPTFVVADEPVSALDVSIQAQILNLLRKLKSEFNLTYLFIAHNLAVIKHISDRVAVMYLGKIVEMAETEELFRNPKHPYTEALLSAVPEPDPTIEKREQVLRGEVANMLSPPTGCTFHPRCPYAQEICRKEVPPLQELNPENGDSGTADGQGDAAPENAPGSHTAACHFAEELTLKGVY